MNRAKSLPHADSGGILKIAKAHIFFCQNQNPVNFVAVTQFL